MSWQKYRVSPRTSILETMRVIEQAAGRFALVADDDGTLLGAVTDGNIRRGLLNGLGLDERIEAAMNPNPVTALPADSRRAVLKRMLAEDFSHIPVVNEAGKIVDLWWRGDLQAAPVYDNPVVLMAGGLGSRLGELTRDCPKPMLQVGGKPLLEIVLQNFIECGFSQFFFAVNYKAEQIEAHFLDGAKWSVSIEYLREKEPLGTAGALSLLPRTIRLPVLVMNGDILTRLRGNVLIDAHEDSGAVATMVVKPYEVQIPYGIADCADKGQLTGIREKPLLSFPVSAGINVLSPEAIDLIPPDCRYDMPELFQALLRAGKTVETFSMDDYWLDIGHLMDYEKANKEFQQFFTEEL